MRYKLLYANWEKLRNLGDECRALFKVMTHGFVTGSQFYMLVHEGDAPTRTQGATADYLFERFNIGDRAGLPVRSMSVGDIILFGCGQALVCKPVGWEALDSSRNPLQHAFDKDNLCSECKVTPIATYEGLCLDCGLKARRKIDLQELRARKN
jgi:hypothetical protein